MGQSFHQNIEEIILYGSVVENTLTFRSDIDIAIRFKTINLREATLVRKHLLGKVNSLVDIQVYNVLPPSLKEEIRRKGKTLYHANKR